MARRTKYASGPDWIYSAPMPRDEAFRAARTVLNQMPALADLNAQGDDAVKVLPTVTVTGDGGWTVRRRTTPGERLRWQGREQRKRRMSAEEERIRYRWVPLAAGGSLSWWWCCPDPEQPSKRYRTNGRICSCKDAELHNAHGIRCKHACALTLHLAMLDSEKRDQC